MIKKKKSNTTIQLYRTNRVILIRKVVLCYNIVLILKSFLVFFVLLDVDIS